MNEITTLFLEGGFPRRSVGSVRVIRTDEECMIAKTVCRVLGLG